MNIKSVQKNVTFRAINWLLKNAPQQVHSAFGVHNNGSLTPSYSNMSTNLDYLKAYTTNIGVGGVIDVKANAKGNVRFKIVDLEDNEITMKEMTSEQKHIYNLLKQPNVFQSSYEFWRQYEVFKCVFGNAYWYFSFPETYEGDIMHLTSFTNLWSQFMSVNYTGRYFDAESIDEVIDKYVLSMGTNWKKEFEPASIVHRNDVSVELDPESITLGISKLKNLRMAISNIDIAFGSRNVISKKRGALGIFTSDMKDATGNLPLTKDQKKKADTAFEKYGTLESQQQYILNEYPLKFQRTGMNMKDLMLFEEVATDVMHIAHKFGVPEVLVKAYLQGATFENQQASERRLYETTIIPETEDDILALNTYLKCEEYGFRIKATFDHIAVLQEDLKNRATVNRLNGQTMKELFMTNGCSIGEWRKAISLPVKDEDKDKYMLDFSDEELARMGIITIPTPPNTNSNGAS